MRRGGGGQEMEGGEKGRENSRRERTRESRGQGEEGRDLEEMGERKGYTMELLASVSNTMKFLRLVFSFLW